MPEEKTRSWKGKGKGNELKKIQNITISKKKKKTINQIENAFQVELWQQNKRAYVKITGYFMQEMSVGNFTPRCHFISVNRLTTPVWKHLFSIDFISLIYSSVSLILAVTCRFV